MVKLKIETKEDWERLSRELTKNGLLDKVNDVALSEDLFPIEVPIDMDAFLSLVKNPLVKPFKKKINATLTDHVVNVMATAMAR